MTVQSGMFRSNGGDRKYTAAFFASYFASFIGNGVFPNPSSGLQVVPGSNLNTTVRIGKGWINGYYMINDSDYTVNHDIADGVLSRIDRIVFGLNFLTREITIYVKKGLPSSSPVAPNLQRDNDIYELALADVRINNGATSINASNITDLRLNNQLCGIVQGVVNQVDTTTIFNQYQAALQNLEQNGQVSFDIFLQDRQQQFDVFFQNIQDTLDGDVAANLANQIIQTNQNLSDLQDSFNSYVSTNDSRIGNVNDLQTTSKIIVNAINEVKLQANDIKTKVSNVVGSPLTSADTSDQIVSKIQTIKNTLAGNLVVKGVSASGSETLQSLVGKVSEIQTGGSVSGTVTSSSNTLNFRTFNLSGTLSFPHVTVSGLNFRPSLIILKAVYQDEIRIVEYNQDLLGTSESIRLYTVNGSTINGVSNFHFKGNENSSYINSTGFRLPVQSSLYSYSWTAYR